MVPVLDIRFKIGRNVKLGAEIVSMGVKEI